MQIHLNEKELTQVKELAAVFFTPKEVALVMDQPTEAFVAACADEADPIGRAFLGGRLQSEFTVRQRIISLANSGSSPAQTQVLEMIKQSNMKMIDR